MTENKEFLYMFFGAMGFVILFFILAANSQTAYYKCLDKIEYVEAEEFDKLIGTCERLR